MADRKAGVIGLGMIGAGITESLLRKGFVPEVYDISPEASAPFSGRAGICASPKEVAKNTDVIMVCVVNEKQAESVLFGGDGILSAEFHGVVCLVSTVSVDAAVRYARRCHAAGAGFLDCGVTPGNLAAENGMVAITGGTEEDYAFAREVLEGWSKKVVYCGGPGSGMCVKIARNVITFGGWRVVKEAQRLVEANGIRAEALADVIETSDPEGSMLLLKLHDSDENGKIPAYIAAKNVPLMKKDLQAAHDLAVESGVSMPVMEITRAKIADTMDAAETDGGKSGRERGAEVADLVYGPGFGARMLKNEGNLYSDATLEQVFAGVWDRPGLTLKERRLLVLGVAAAQGRADLVKIQALAALGNGEMTPDELEEAVLQLSYYAGWCAGGSVAQGVSEAVRKFEETKGKERGET